MKILAHRGLWLNRNEQNTIEAFRRAFTKGYGIETDLRDYHGKIAISHDPPLEIHIYAQELLELHSKIDKSAILALNIKADGLQEMLRPMLLAAGVSNYFTFDMAVPDSINYIRSGLACFTRQSEYEVVPAFYELALGVWMDEFNGHWIENAVILEHIQNNKRVCLVSPELHGRPFDSEWYQYKNIVKSIPDGDIMLCTDYPDQANTYFNQT